MTSNTQSEPEEKPTLEGFVAKARKLTYSMPDRKSAEVFDALLDVIASIPSQISEAVKAERERNASVRNAGELLSTIAFNLSQQAGAPLSAFNANLLRKRCEEWDAAIRARGES